MDWKRLLARLVAASSTQDYPLCVFEVKPPSGQPWPAGLPACPDLKEFYALCDGGTLSLQYTFLPLAELGPETERWRQELPKLSTDENPWRLTDQMVVLGEDSGGALLVWDAQFDAVSALYWRGGDWEPFHLTFNTFMETLFFDPNRVHADDLWIEALSHLTAREST